MECCNDTQASVVWFVFYFHDYSCFEGRVTQWPTTRSLLASRRYGNHGPSPFRAAPAPPGAKSCHTPSSLNCAWGTWLTGYTAHDPAYSALRNYTAGIYDGVVEVEVDKLAFFWNIVAFYEQPSVRRPLNAVLGACNDCAGHFRKGALWFPFPDAAARPTEARCNAVYGFPTRPRPLPALIPLQRGGTFFPGFFRHVTYPSALPDGAWVEVMRITRKDDKVAEGDRCLEGQIWFWHAPGSGIWYNIGRSKVLDASFVGAARRFLTCRTAQRVGYDSIQIPAGDGAYAFEIVDCRGPQPTGRRALRFGGARHRPEGRLLVSWTRACPPPHVELRRGTPAPRVAAALGAAPNVSATCNCDARFAYLNCYGDAA